MTPAAADAKSLQSCPTLCDPRDSSPPGSLSLGFSRQEYWSGLPFPSPRHESEKWKWSTQLCPTLSDPMDCSPPGSSVHGIFQARVLEWGAIAFSNIMIMLCYAKSLQACLTLCNPIDGSPPDLLSLGFSRQEHWSGWPFPPSMHESEKWKWSPSVMSEF